MSSNNISIISDHREAPSGIPFKLSELIADTEIKTLKRGDYIINGQIIVERKTKDDFVTSLIQNKLFLQISNLAKDAKLRPVLLIEGNPYNTKHEIDREAIKGALLSINVSWHIPIVYSVNTDETAKMLVLMAEQNLENRHAFYRAGYKPKTIAKRQVYFLQGLPNIGPKLATALLEKFGSIENIILADEEELGSIEGIGKTKAKKIRGFLHYKAEN